MNKERSSEDISLAVRYLFALPYQEVVDFIGEGKFKELFTLASQSLLNNLNSKKAELEKTISELILKDIK